MKQDDVNLIYNYLKERFDYRNDGLFIDKTTRQPWFGNQCKRSNQLFFEITIRTEGKKFHMSYGHAIYIYHHQIKPKYLEYINENTVDYRIENLKPINMSQRILKEDCNKKNKHGFRGVVKDGNRFGARIGINGKYKYISWHDTAEKAHEAYLQAKKAVSK